jgi:hypothetical protein
MEHWQDIKLINPDPDTWECLETFLLCIPGMNTWLVKVNMKQGPLSVGTNPTITYSYRSEYTIKVMGMIQGVRNGIYYLMIREEPDIFHIARCLEIGSILSISDWIVDTTLVPFTSIVYEFSSDFSLLAVVRTDELTSPLYTVVKVSASSPYDLLDPSTTYVDSSVMNMITKGLRVSSDSQLIVLLVDKSDWSFWIGQVDYAGVILPTIQYSSVLQN